MSEKKERHEPTLYEDRGEFLASAVGEKRKAFSNLIELADADNDPVVTKQLLGFAASQHQFDKAVAEHLGASTTALSKADLQKMIGEEFKAMLKDKEFPE